MSGSETPVSDQEKVEPKRDELAIGDVAGETDDEEPVSLTVRDRGRYKKLSGPGGVFGLVVPASWAATATRRVSQDGSPIYSLIAALDIESFKASWAEPGASMTALPLFTDTGFVCNRQTIDALMDLVSPREQGSPERSANRVYDTTGIIRTKTHFGFESWTTKEGTEFEIMAGSSQDQRWMYLLIIQGIDPNREVSNGDIVDKRTYSQILPSNFARRLS